MWRFTIDVGNVAGPLGDVRLDVQTWDGTNTVRLAPVQVAATTQFAVADNIRSVTLAFTHARYAPLAFILARDAQEPVWRWTNPLQLVTTSGQDVRVGATLVRLKHAETTYVPESQILQLARDAKEPKDLDAQRNRRNPPTAVRAAPLRGALLEKGGQLYRRSGAPNIARFHILNPDPLGDPKAAGWARFSSSTLSVSPWTVSRTHLFEYGDVGTDARGPRFLVAVWMPNAVANVGYPEIDMLVWFTPNTTLPFYPADEYPFHGDYPYTLMALGGATRDPKTKAYASHPYDGDQKYTAVGFGHLLGSHVLAHQMIAAGRAAAIVVPVAPSAQFELWESPVTLMRMLKEISRYIPRNDNDRVAKVHPKPPRLGRVGVAGFSAAGQRLLTLLNRPGPALHYVDPVWGTSADAREFDAAWSELWCIDGNFGTKHHEFLEKVTRWARQGTSRARIYKNDFTDGRWDPRAESNGEFANWVKKATVQHREDGTNWAISCADSERQMQVVSVSKSYVVSPTSTEQPAMPDATHENMPRIFFGHAAVTSGFKTMKY